MWGKNFLKEVLPPHPYLKNLQSGFAYGKKTRLSQMKGGEQSSYESLEEFSYNSRFIERMTK
jgi:hypothetical protein